MFWKSLTGCQGMCRIVIGVQLVIAGFQLPARYQLKRWKEMLICLLPVMTIMWLCTTACIMLTIPKLSLVSNSHCARRREGKKRIKPSDQITSSLPSSSAPALHARIPFSPRPLPKVPSPTNMSAVSCVRSSPLKLVPTTGSDFPFCSSPSSSSAMPTPAAFNSRLPK